MSDPSALRAPAASASASDQQASADQPGEAAVWSELTTTRDLAAFARAWLVILAGSTSGIVQACFFSRASATESFAPLARWTKDPAAGVQHFTEGAQPVLAAVLEGRQPAIEATEEGGTTRFAGMPVVVDGKLFGAVIVEAIAVDARAARRLMRQLQWGSAWMEAFARRAIGADASDMGQRAAALIDTINAIIAEPSALAAGHAFASRLAAIFRAGRVAIGYRRWKKTRLAVLLQTSTFDRKHALGVAIQGAMDEAVDQAMTLATPSPPGMSYVAAAQNALAARNGGAAILTVPMMRREEPIGAVTLERFDGTPFTQDEVDLCDALTAAVGPILMEKRQHDWSLPRVAIDRLNRASGHVASSANLGYKLLALLAIAAAAFLFFATDTYRIHATAQIQGEVRRVINAPFDGYVRSQFARAGEVVRAGELLAELEDNDISLDRLRHVAERRQYQLELDRALGNGDLAAANIARAQIVQKDAEIDLSDQMLARTQIKAPFDSVVVSGDLSQSIGRPVSRGDILFELAPLDRYRITMIVPEVDVQSVQAGQEGELLLSALPEHPFRFAVRTVTPVARTADGVNGFETRADLLESDPRLRPAMEGLAKIEIGRRNLAWIWTHSFFSWLRIKAWGLVP